MLFGDCSMNDLLPSGTSCRGAGQKVLALQGHILYFNCHLLFEFFFSLPIHAVDILAYCYCFIVGGGLLGVSCG